MKAFRLLSAIASAVFLAGCGGGDGSSANSFAGSYTGAFSEATPAPGTVTGAVTLTVASDGTVTGTATDSRHAGTGAVASGSAIDRDGTATLIVTYATPDPDVTTTMSGTLARTAPGEVTGTLTEAGAGGAGGPTFAYTLNRAID